MTKSACFLVVVSALFGGVALADVPDAGPASPPWHGRGHGRGGPGFALLDADGNGVVSRDEMRKAALGRFDAVDGNHDNRVSLDEILLSIKERHAGRMQHLDKNGDGKVTREEASRMPDAIFNSLDKNGDKVLSADELSAIPVPRERFIREMFAKHDANHDGFVTREEAQAAADREFAEMDKNGDGALSHDELRAGHERLGFGPGPHGMHFGPHGMHFGPRGTP